MRASLIVAGFFTTAFGQVQYTSTGTAAIAKAKATALTESPTSNIAGKSFNRFVTIWCENTDYDMAAGDRKWNPVSTFLMLTYQRTSLGLPPRESL